VFRNYTYDNLPAAVRDSVPTDIELDRAVTAAFTGEGTLTLGATPTNVTAFTGEGTLTPPLDRDAVQRDTTPSDPSGPD